MRLTATSTCLFSGIAFLVVGLAAACSSASSGGSGGSGGTGKDASVVDGGGSVGDECAPIDSQCGQPCDKGNSLGVGQFCNHVTDCTNTPQAHLCSSLGSLTTHFCTFRCSEPDAEPPEGGDGSLPFPTSCGTGAVCTCDNGGNCGCTPASCLGP